MPTGHLQSLRKRCQYAVLHRCSEHQYLVHYYLGNAPSNCTATSLLSSFVGPDSVPNSLDPKFVAVFPLEPKD